MMTTPEYFAMKNDNDEIVTILMLDESLGCFYRDAGDWVPMDDEDALPFELEQLTSHAITRSSVSAWEAGERARTADLQS